MTELNQLNAQVERDLDILNLDHRSWQPPVDGVHDVVIVGGGQSGMGAAFGLLRERVRNVLIIDENSAGEEGPWVTYARMVTLRTPKELLSIDIGIPSLTFRSWWEAQHGEAGWHALDKIPRQEWMAYLRWFREVLNLPIENETRLLRIAPPVGGVYELTVSNAQGERTLRARKVVLATGIQGGGEWHTPPMITEALPESRYAHTSEAIDYRAMAGKRIAILGGGASAFDNANYALERGVAEAHVFVRRERLPQVNPIRYMEQTGFIPRFSALSDPDKYVITASFLERNQPPTNDTFQRAAEWPGFALHLGSPWTQVKDTPQGVEVTTPKGVHVYDFVVLSTGLVTDPALRPELSDIASSIACWRDRYAPEGPPNALMDAHPYLGQGFEYLPKSPEDAEAVRGLFAFNYSALISLGLSASALSGLRFAIPKLANAIADQLFLDHKKDWVEGFLTYDDPEFLSEWTPDKAHEKADAK